MFNIELKPFDQMDWMAFAGAEGDNPLVAYETITLDGKAVEAAIVVDDHGMEINILDGNTFAYETDYRTAKLTAEETLKWDSLTTDALIAFGFYVA